MSTTNLALCIALVLLTMACSSDGTKSEDPNLNYGLVFFEMPLPRPAVVHSHLDREDSVRFVGFRLYSREDEWQFELVATPAWVEELRREFTMRNWSELELRPNRPAWFSPDPQAFEALVRRGESDVAPAHLFIECAPKNPDEVHLFVSAHTRVWGRHPVWENDLELLAKAYARGPH